MFGWQAKFATTNGIFWLKILQINIVENEQIFYNFYNLPMRENGIGLIQFLWRKILIRRKKKRLQPTKK
jgi:hypothetical protein